MRTAAAVAVLLFTVGAYGCGGLGGAGIAPLRLANRDELRGALLDTIPERLGSCDPSTLGPGDTLRVTFDRPHPPQLAARTPDGGWRYIVHPFVSLGPSLMPPERFAGLDTVVLVAGATPATVPVEGRDTEPVFSAPGAHRLLVLSHLGTDAARPIWSCAITVREP